MLVQKGKKRGARAVGPSPPHLSSPAPSAPTAGEQEARLPLRPAAQAPPTSRDRRRGPAPAPAGRLAKTANYRGAGSTRGRGVGGGREARSPASQPQTAHARGSGRLGGGGGAAPSRQHAGACVLPTGLSSHYRGFYRKVRVKILKHEARYSLAQNPSVVSQTTRWIWSLLHSSVTSVLLPLHSVCSNHSGLECLSLAFY